MRIVKWLQYLLLDIFFNEDFRVNGNISFFRSETYSLLR